MIRKVLPLAAAIALTFSAAVAQEPVTAFSKHISRVDLALSGAGLFNKSVSGLQNPKGIVPCDTPVVLPCGPQFVADSPSNTLGALLTIRYIAKPYFGLEFNYGYARYTQNYSGLLGEEPNLGVQANANEYTLGYVVTPPHPFFGFQPFVSVGAGTMEFKPTPFGGQSLSPQARATYYYSAGIQKEYFSHVGLRASFRQNFFIAPDFGQNYLTINQRTISSSPTLGVYLKF